MFQAGWKKKITKKSEEFASLNLASYLFFLVKQYCIGLVGFFRKHRITLQDNKTKVDTPLFCSDDKKKTITTMLSWKLLAWESNKFGLAIFVCQFVEQMYLLVIGLRR